jgi:cytochrome c
VNRRRALSLAFGAFALAAATVEGSPSQAAGSPGAGGALFRQKCAICHRTAPNAHSIGPSLYGAFGREAGTAEGYRFSDALGRLKLRWDEESLSAYLKDPRAAAPGNKMNFPGVPDAGQRADLVAYIRSLAAPQP